MTIRDDFKKINNLFNNIIQIAILYFDKLPGFLLSAITCKTTYSRNSYLENMSICYIEILYELIGILRSICGLDSRTKFFFDTYSEYVKPYLDNIIDLGVLNYLLRVVRDLSWINFM